MPCNIGYKKIEKVSIPVPAPQEFKEEAKAPDVDADLLEKIGEDDPVFLEWLLGADMVPLWSEALRRAAESMDLSGLETRVMSDGRLFVRGMYRDEERRAQFQKTTEQLARRFQMQMLAIVAQLLDYRVVVKEVKSRGGSFVLEGEKDVGLSVNRYLKIEQKSGESEIAFEHFESADALDAEEQKFLALAERFGVKITEKSSRRSGNPILGTDHHKGFLGEA